jgi:cbb3-type cytochrome oxidase subunit 3
VNPVRDAAVEAAGLGWLPGIVTALFLVGFGGWAVWAYLPRNRARFEAAARLPFNDGDDR